MLPAEAADANRIECSEKREFHLPFLPQYREQPNPCVPAQRKALAPYLLSAPPSLLFSIPKQMCINTVLDMSAKMLTFSWGVFDRVARGNPSAGRGPTETKNKHAAVVFTPSAEQEGEFSAVGTKHVTMEVGEHGVAGVEELQTGGGKCGLRREG